MTDSPVLHGEVLDVDQVLALPAGAAAGPDLGRAEVATRAWLRARYAKSRNSGEAYERDFWRWWNWCTATGVDPLTARRAELDTWVTAMRTEPKGRPGPARQADSAKSRKRAKVAAAAPPAGAELVPAGAAAPGKTVKAVAEATLARRVATISSWYAYLIEDGVIDRNPVTKSVHAEVAVDRDVSLTTGLSKPEAKLFRAQLAGEPARLRVALLLLLVLGLRVSEVTGADWSSLGYGSGHRLITVVRKGGKKQALPVPGLVSAAIDDLEAAVHGIGGQLAGPLVPAGPAGGRTTRTALTRAIRRIARAAGIPSWAQLSPHSLRHAAATISLDEGAALRDVQDLLGHADPRTTRRYDRARGQHDRSPAYTLAAALAD